MEVDSVFITGANRGIGLELVRQIVQLPTPPRYVFATFRNKDTVEELEEIRDSSKHSLVILVQMDVLIDEDIKAALKIAEGVLKDKGLNLLINNAGAYKFEAFPNISDENLLFNFTANALGPIKVLRGFHSLLRTAAKSKKEMSVSRAAVINISSWCASIGLLDDPEMSREWTSQAIGYRMSKVSLNMAMRVLSFQMKDDGILVVNVCPAWNKTDMGTDSTDEENTVPSLLRTFQRLNEHQHGAFVDIKGATIPY